MPVVVLSAHYNGQADRDLASRVGANILVRRTPGFDAELEALRHVLDTRDPAPITASDRTVYEEHLRTNAHQLTKLLATAKRAEDRYRRLLEHANDAIMITTPEGKILEANGRWRDILGVPIEELVGRSLREYGASFRTKALLAAKGGTFDPMPISRPDGGIVQMVLSLTVVEIEGAPVVLVIGNDVTEALQKEREATAVSQRYRALVEHIPEVIWTRAHGEPTTFFTPNAEALFGESLPVLATATRDSHLMHVHVDDRPMVAAAFRSYSERSVPFDIEYRYRRKDGRWLWLRNRGFDVPDRDGVQVAEGMISDVTERKRLEDDLRQAQKMEALGQLTGGIAHDFNNILAVILAHAQFLVDELPAGGGSRDDAVAIRNAGERAATLTRHLLAFSRRQLLEPKTVDLNATVAGVQRMLKTIIRENIAFSFAPTTKLGSIRIDVGQLEQVIMNLVVNACDAMPEGGALTIATDEEPATGSVILRVCDTGHGMDDATRARIFEPFFTTKEKGRGTGLGLATCYGIIEQSGGRISVESEVGHGTTFTIRLPRVDECPAAAVEGPSYDVTCGEETILLVEDDLGVRAVIQRVLESRGYHVIVAADTDDALAIGLSGAKKIDLIVSDVIMPSVSGPVVVERIRERFPHMKALFISGYADPPALRSGAIAAGMRIIEKPFKPFELLRAVRAELAR